MADYSDGTAYGTAVSAGMVLVETKVLAADATSVTFSNLNGDQDQCYRLIANLVQGTTDAMYYHLQPNGLATNQRQMDVYAAAATTLGAVNGTTMYLGEIAASGAADLSSCFLVADIFAKTGFRRSCIAQSVSWIASFADDSQNCNIVFSQWNETSTNITSLEVLCTVASGIAVGSTLSLFKVR